MPKQILWNARAQGRNIRILELLADRKPYRPSEICILAGGIGITSRTTVHKALMSGTKAGILEKLESGDYVMTPNGSRLLRELRRKYEEDREVCRRREVLPRLPDRQKDFERFIIKGSPGEPPASATVAPEGASYSVHDIILGPSGKDVRKDTEAFVEQLRRHLPSGVWNIGIRIDIREPK